MGAINNAFNQAAGTVAGAALVIQHAKETDFSKMNSADSTALVARNQARATNEEENEAINEAEEEGGLKDQLFSAKIKRAKAKEAYNKAVKRRNSLPKTRFKRFTELTAAQEAENELKNKYQALMELKNRAAEQRAYADKATKMALEAKEKFEKHWGGK